LDTDKTKTQSVLDKHQGLQKNLIAILLDVQECFNYLPPDALRHVAKALGMPLIDIIGVATFYRAFSLKPRGKHTCLVCLGTACHVRGGPRSWRSSSASWTSPPARRPRTDNSPWRRWPASAAAPSGRSSSSTASTTATRPSGRSGRSWENTRSRQRHDAKGEPLMPAKKKLSIQDLAKIREKTKSLMTIRESEGGPG